MFGEEQRQKAVDLYFQEGMTLKKVIAELGYPSEGCLMNWIARDPRHGRRHLSCTLDVKARVVSASGDGERPILHSDRGCHYRWPGWIRICKGNGLVRSMSAKGCSPDNAAMEGFFSRLKNEFSHCRDWKGVGYDEFHERLPAYLNYYNQSRIKKSLGWMSPAQYRRSLGPVA